MAPSTKMTMNEQTIERYSYTELKRAQTQCVEKATKAALVACGATSDAQKEVFKAHVNDLCASVFTAVLRQYDPVEKENLEPVDDALLARVHEMEAKLKEKEKAVQELREKVPRLAAEKTREQLQQQLKRSSEVLLVVSTDPETEQSLVLEDEKVEAIMETYEQTSKSIVAAASKLDRALSQTTETITVVERAMKRPKTAVDMAMEKSPAKLNLTVKTPAVVVAEEDNSSLRSRLALHLTSAKNT